MDLTEKIRQVVTPDFQSTDRNLLIETYRQVFLQDLNWKCQNCVHDAYWLLKVELKRRTAPMKHNSLKKYTIIRPFKIHTSKYGTLVPDDITDDQIDYVISLHIDNAQYFELKPVAVEKTEPKAKTVKE